VAVSTENAEVHYEKPESFTNVNNHSVDTFYKVRLGSSEVFLSSGHRNLVYSRKSGNHSVKSTIDLAGGNNCVYTNFAIRSMKGINYTDHEIRFMVALAADGSNYKEGVQFKFKRTRKIERFEKL
jgi:hypothetical protein